MTVARAAKYCVVAIFCLALISLCLLWWSLSTESGSRNLLSASQNKLRDLSYQYESGNILDGLIFSEASWNLKNGTEISASKLQVIPDPACLRGKEVCINRGNIRHLIIRLPLKNDTSEKIKLRNISTPISLTAENVRVGTLTIEHPTRPPIKFHDLRFTGKVTESDISIDHLSTQWKKLNLEGSGTLKMQNDYPLDMRGIATRDLNTESLSINWKADGTLQSLKLDAKLNEPVNGNLQGVVSLLDRNRPADMRLTWNTISLPLQKKQAENALQKTPVVELSSGVVNITGGWPEYRIEGHASIEAPGVPDGAAELTGKLTTNKLIFEPLIIKAFDGDISTQGEFSWIQGLRWNLQYNATNINPNRLWTGTTGSINGTGKTTGVIQNGEDEIRITDIDTRAFINGHPITATGNLIKDTHWNIHNLNLKSNDNNASANGRLGEEVKLVFSIKATENFHADVKGDLNGEIAIRGEVKNPTLEGSITSSQLSYKTFRTQNARINGALIESGNKPSKINFNAQSMRVKRQEIVRPALLLQGTLTDHLLRLKFDSDPLESAVVVASGAMDEHHNWNGTVKTASGKLAERAIGLRKPFTATWINQNQTIAVAPHCWQHHFASVCVKESALIGKTGVVKFAMDQLPLESVAQLLPGALELSGNLQSNGTLNWGPNQKTTATVDSSLNDASARLNKRINGKRLELDIPVARLKVTTTGNIIKGRLDLETDKFASVTADVQLDTTRHFNPFLTPLQGSVNVSESDLMWIKDYLPDVNLLTGSVSGQATVLGTLSKPQISGALKLQKASLHSSIMPVKITNMGIDVTVTNKKADINGTALANGTDIKISGTGELLDSGFSSNFNLSGANIKLQHEYARRAIISPDINFSVRPDNITISGKVTVPSADLVLKKALNEGLVLSKDVIVTDEIGDNAKPAASSGTVGSIGVDTRINIALGNDVSVSALGLNADLNGDFEFTLASQQPPSLSGAINVSSGSYEAYGQKLKIRQGDVTFTGPVEQTALSIEAVREIKDLTTGVRIRGTLKNPGTELFSEPPLPEDQILPYILLGRNLELNQNDTDLTTKAALLLGVQTGQKLSSGLASKLGIDDFSLSAWGTGDDTQILVSGRLTDRLLLRYGVGVFKDSNSLYLRYDLSNRLYLETTQGIESAVDLFYTFDF